VLGLVVAILSIVAIVAVKYVWQSSHKEGFVGGPANKKQAKIPKTGGSSTVPNTMPGATTKDSSESLASFKDLVELLELMKTYSSLYEPNMKRLYKNKRYTLLHANSIAYIIRLQSQIDTGSIVDYKPFILREQKKYTTAIQEIRGGGMSKEGPGKSSRRSSSRSGKAGRMGDVTMADIENVVDRATREEKKLEEKRSGSPDIKNRIKNLERIRLDLSDIMTKVGRGDMSIEDVPFTKKDLSRFLDEINDAQSSIKPIPRPKAAQRRRGRSGSRGRSRSGSRGRSRSGSRGRSRSGSRGRSRSGSRGRRNSAGGNGADIGSLNAAALLQQLRSATNDLSWEVRLGYDPEVTMQRRIMERIRAISKEIDSGSLTENELASKMIEMATLKQQFGAQNKRRIAQSSKPLGAYESFNGNNAPASIEPYVPTPVEPVGASPAPMKGKIIEALQPPIASNDWRVRPGYTMSTEEIALRGSASSFDSETTGPDYKKRALFLCSQIRDSGIGDPHEFGCVKNPKEDVGKDYSWRGNYKMVCNRLGRMWGEWYPEMFGCPKSDASVTQAPMVNRDKNSLF